MLTETRREVDKNGRALVAAVLRQAMQDLHSVKYLRSKTKKVEDTYLRESAKRFLDSQDAKDLALALGISSACYNRAINA